jgi:hypothetical protein
MLARHPARMAAMADGLKTFTSNRPCPRGHLIRYVENPLICAECHKKRVTKNLAADAKREAVLPMIGGDYDCAVTQRRLIAASEKFVRLLYAEAMTAIREGVSQ